MGLIRFFTVAVAGVILDISVAYMLKTVFGVPLWIAAAIGFAIAAVINYMAHEFWTFRTDSSRISLVRVLQYVGASALTLGARLVVVAGLSTWLGETYTLAILICGAGVSFFVNFAVSKFVIFKSRSDPEEPTH